MHVFNALYRISSRFEVLQFTPSNSEDTGDMRCHADYNPGVCGGGGGYSDIRRLGSFFGFKILNFNIFVGFQKNNFFWV